MSTTTPISLEQLPDELLLQLLCFLDVPELLVISRTCRRLRGLSLDPPLHRLRLKSSIERVNYLLPKRPALHSLQPPNSTIYLTRTHVAARRLHWSLVCIRLNRSLARRPKLTTLIATNILPKECCRFDRRSGDFVWGYGVAGPLVERKRKIERERLKEGLRVWLERKAREIPARHRDGGVGVLVWRFSKRLGLNPGMDACARQAEQPKKERVNGLKRFWESLGTGTIAPRRSGMTPAL
ncbi:hypothetical protein AMS68_007465 [Peltaster fructicola]|uniref:F-box domain-containing protein n=1 Tax=Peltaster fructicola TaxID=286661 RepID=A0A6H0Y526_9PEZI|nr:hypothetical protein AMS68_007465 [Peltaster fructicola]